MQVVKAQIDTGRKRGVFPLIRIRNPWGNDTEWRGAWCDGAREWKYIPAEEKDRLGLTFDEDGEFFMSLRDFMANFDMLELCNLEPDSLDEEEVSAGKLQWNEHVFTGSWLAGLSAGGCRNHIATFASNPQFRVVLRDSDDDDDDLCTCVVSLMQKGSRNRKVRGRGGCLTIGQSLVLAL